MTKESRQRKAQKFCLLSPQPHHAEVVTVFLVDADSFSSGKILRLYLSSIGVTIAAGTSEILKNIIVSSSLKLRRER
jgi:hypothetical protein